ncbi:ABC transporter [Actinoplanes sp. ATCC 53533]|uniref:ABC transporter permease n=1 Tax=Actinoplanes sp. ATCC 53533 TaxID=1288362 RepID=UPI000F7999A2|nr:ABC transporter permease [Actinoplanes sp. ATCC 53533]RSM48411.1 ABC transporter [Actinoplanes sp. ATCC 53533]
MTGWRAALRVARREARRARGRSALVIAMIALPVAAMAFTSVTYDTFTLRPGEEADRLMGAGQAAMRWPQEDPLYQDPAELSYLSAPRAAAAVPETVPTLSRLLALLPPGSRAISDHPGRLTVHTATGIGVVATRALDYADPLARGILRPVAGRPPAAADEVALTPAATARLGTRLGGTVRPADGSRTLRVVGLVEDPTDIRATAIVVRPGGPPADPRAVTWLVATPGPLTWPDVKRLNTRGVVAVSRHVLAHPPGVDERYPEFRQEAGVSETGLLMLIAGLAALEIVLLAGPAFAVSARRRSRDLALVAAVGGTPAQVRRIVLADGVVLGAVAAGAGVLLGVAVAAGVRPGLEEHLTHVRSGPLRVFPLALAVLAGLAVVTGVLAALVPAWISARQDVVAALAGRRGITRSRRRWVVLGTALGAVGVAVAAVGAWRVDAPLVLAGLVLAELGLVLCTPAIVGLVTRLGRFLPLAPRIALRDTSRNRTAAAPAISAVIAAVIPTLAVGMVLTASDARARADYRPLGRVGDVFVSAADPGQKTRPGGSFATPPEVSSALRSTLPVARIHQIGEATCATQECLVVARTPPERRCPYANLGRGRDPTAAEQRAARRDARCDGVGNRYDYFGGALSSDVGMTLVLDPEAVGALVDIPAEEATRVATAMRAGAVVVDDPRLLDNGRATMEVRADPSGEVIRTVTAPGIAFAQPPRAPLALLSPDTARSLGLSGSTLVTLATTNRVPTVAEQDRLRAALGNGYDVVVERRPQPDRASLLVLAIVAGVITLGAAAIATGLAAADGRADLAMLAAVGASPWVRRALSLSQAGLIAGLGSVLGAIAGLGAATAVLAADNRNLDDVWPVPTPYPIAVPWLNVTIALLVVPVVAMLGAGLLTRSRLPIERRP